jgi:phage/plasmid-like protein (TIGR03299 family)
MAHELETRMMSANGIVPWHGLANVIPGLATGREALQLGGLDWTVMLKPISCITREGVSDTDEYFAVIRSTDQKILGVVKKRYTLFQNHQAVELGETIVGASSGKAIWETAGSLRGGSRGFLAINTGACEIVKNDEIRAFILITWSHDGSLNLEVVNCFTRPVCANTIAMAKAENGLRIKLKHTGSIVDKAADAAMALRIVQEDFGFLAEAMKRFAEKPLTDEITSYVLDRTIPLVKRVVVSDDPKLSDAADRGYTLNLNRRERVKELIYCGIGNDMPGVEGTCYSLLNAFTEYGTHEAIVRPHKGRDENEVRFESSMFGPGNEMKVRAFKALQEIC